MLKSVLAAFQSPSAASTASENASSSYQTPLSGMFQRLQEIAQVAAGWINVSRASAPDVEQHSRVANHVKVMHGAMLNAADALDTFISRSQKEQLTPGDTKAAGKNFADAVAAVLTIDRALSVEDRRALCESCDAKLAVTEMHSALRDLVKLGQTHIPAAYAEAKRRDFCLAARGRYIDEIESQYSEPLQDERRGSRPHDDTFLDLADGIDQAFNPAGPNVQALHDAAYRAWERDCALAIESSGTSARPNEELVLGIKERVETELLAFEPGLAARQAAIHSHFAALDDAIREMGREYKPRVRLELTTPSLVSSDTPDPVSPEVTDAVSVSDVQPADLGEGGKEAQEPALTNVADLEPAVVESDLVAVSATGAVQAEQAPLTPAVGKVFSLPIVAPTTSVAVELTVSAQPTVAAPVTSREIIGALVSAVLERATVEVLDGEDAVDTAGPLEAVGRTPVIDEGEEAAPAPLHLVAQVEGTSEAEASGAPPAPLAMTHVTEPAQARPLQLVGAGTFVASASAPVVHRSFGRVGWRTYAAAAAMVALAAVGSYFSSPGQKTPAPAPTPQVALNDAPDQIKPSPTELLVSTPDDAPQATELAVNPPAQTPAQIEAETAAPLTVATVPSSTPDSTATPEGSVTAPLTALPTQKIEPEHVATNTETSPPRLFEQAVSRAVSKASSYSDDLERFWNSLVAAAQHHADAIEKPVDTATPPAAAVAAAQPELPGQQFVIGDLSSPPPFNFDAATTAQAQADAPAQQFAVGDLSSPPIFDFDAASAGQSEKENAIGSLQSPFPAGLPQQVTSAANSTAEFGLGSLGSAFILETSSTDIAPSAVAASVATGVEANIGTIGSPYPVDFADIKTLGEQLAATSLRLEERSAPTAVHSGGQSSEIVPVGISVPLPVRTLTPFGGSGIGFLQSAITPEIIEDISIAAARPSDEIGFLQAAPAFASGPVNERVPVAPVTSNGTLIAMGSLQSTFDFAAAVLTPVQDETDDNDFFTLGTLGQPFGKLASAKQDIPMRTASTDDGIVRLGMLDEKTFAPRK